MATLFISVFDGAVEVLFDRPVQQTTVIIAVSSAQSAVISGTNKMRRVRLYSDVDCFVEWGADPTALTDGTAGLPLGADNPEVIGMNSGERIAVIERA